MKYQLFTLLLIGAASAAKDISSDCSSSQRDAIINANQACAQLANAAAEAAKSGSREIFEEFFKDGSDSTRSEVAERFRKVADECSSSSEGILTSSCTDQRQHCQGNILAYTHWEIQGEKREGGTCYCRSYFELEASSGSCGEQSQGSNTLHETTHAVIDTQDVTYGLDNVKGLSSSQALQNADTYTFYAIAVNLNCDENGSSGGRDQSNGSSNSGGSEENSSYGAGSQSNPPSFSDGDNDGSAGGGSQSSPPSYSDNDGLRGFLKKWSFGLGLPKTHSMHNWDVETQKENWEKGGFKAVTWFA